MDTQVEISERKNSLFNDFKALAKRVDRDKPDQHDVDALAAFLHDNPKYWIWAGDLAEQANLSLIESMDAPQSMKQSLKTGLSKMTAEMVRPDDGQLERLMIRQIVGCWLRLSYTEYHYNHHLVAGDGTLAQGDYWERRLTASQRRYTQAIESLARVRRMGLPAVQVNIAEQQVNQVNT